VWLHCLIYFRNLIGPRFANRSMRFMDAYLKGLTGAQAAWAARIYRGHRTVPESLMDDMEAAGLL
jgi:hypothetical protein